MQRLDHGPHLWRVPPPSDGPFHITSERSAAEELDFGTN